MMQQARQLTVRALRPRITLAPWESGRFTNPAAQRLEQVRASPAETLKVGADRLAIHLDQPTAGIAIGERQERLQPRRTGLTLEGE